MSVTATALKARVIELAEEFPETLRECRYFNEDSTPCCIVGKGMADLGIDSHEFLYGDYSGDLNDGTSIRVLAHHEYPTLPVIVENDDDEALEFLQEMQGYQDRGRTWGEALALLEDGDSERW